MHWVALATRAYYVYATMSSFGQNFCWFRCTRDGNESTWYTAFAITHLSCVSCILRGSLKFSMKMWTGSECRRNYVGEEMKRDARQTYESIYTFQLMTLASELKIWLSPLFLGVQVIKLPPWGWHRYFWAAKDEWVV